MLKYQTSPAARDSEAFYRSSGHYQLSFDPLDYPDGSAGAKRDRQEVYKRLVANGWFAKRWTLRNQVQKYAGIGRPDGRVRDVFFVNADKADPRDYGMREGASAPMSEAALAARPEWRI